VIPDDVVDRVRNEADAVAIIGEFVKLKRVGNSFRGPCPFHHGKNPNFSVNERGYNCFKCGESGDVFTFAQKHFGLDFVEAVKWVGARAGVEVREVSRQHDAKDAREPLWEVNATAAEFFRTQLWDAAEAKPAREYLASRSISREDADRFALGYSPRDGNVMRQTLESLGFDGARQLQAGLLVTREDRPEPRARFRGRLMFPIYDVQGHVVGFGGRILGEGEPKYLNSAESEIFSKRNILYGLNWAKQHVRKAERLIVVEGYFDAIRLMLAGIGEVVAPLGTALTEQQSALIRKYTKHVFLFYDSDSAGLKATFRAGDALLAAGITARVITLPEGEDPDTYGQAHGRDGLERAAADSLDVFDRKLQILERSGWLTDLRRKREALDKLLPTLRVTSDRLTRDLYITKTTEVLGVSREMLVKEIDETAVRTEDERPWSPAERERRSGQDERRRAAQAPPSVISERELVRILLHDRRLVERALEEIDPSWFRVLEYRRIFVELSNLGPEQPATAIEEALDPGSVYVLQGLLESNRSDLVEVDHIEAVFSGIVTQLKARVLARQSAQLQMELANTSDEDEKDDLLRRRYLLQRESQALGRAPWKQFRRSNQ
jgi:DNA primase